MRYNFGVTNEEQVIEEIKKKNGAYVIYRDVGGIGDASMILPSITALRRQVGENELIIVATVPYCFPIYINNPNIDYIIDSTKWDNGKTIPDSVTMMADEFIREFNNYGAVVFRLSNKCPCASYEVKNCSKDVTDIVTPRQKIFADSIGVEFSEDDYCLIPTDSELDSASNLIEFSRYIVLHAHSNDKSRDYPEFLNNALIKVLSSLGRDKDFGVVVLQKEKVKYKESNIKYLYNLEFRKVIAIIKRSMGLIGPDSMGVHVAGAMGVPNYGIFGPSDPNVRLKYKSSSWNDRFKKCNRQYCWYRPCVLRFCLRTLVPEDIVSAAWEKMGEVKDETYRINIE